MQTVSHAIALSTERIEFYQQKLGSFWALVDQVDISDKTEEDIFQAFKTASVIWHKRSRDIYCWLPDQLVQNYETDEPQSITQMAEKFGKPFDISADEIVIAERITQKPPRYHYLGIWQGDLEQALKFLAHFDFTTHGISVAPKGTSFPTPPRF